jgi:[acyl-carrier-protein] S-malonyltransferase
MNVFLFPGQGSQEIGMAADLFKTDAVFRALVRRASERTGSDLEKICLRGPERELTRTKNLQPLLVCISLGYLRQLAAAGIVGFETAVDIAAKRGELMDAAAARVTGGMAAVICSEREAVLQLLAQKYSSAQLVLATDNAPSQFVISGEITALEEFTSLIASKKLGQCRRLAVAGPWHSPLMTEAQQDFSSWLNTIEFHPPRVPLIFNLTAGSETDPQKIRQLVARNLIAPVRWRTAMDLLRAAKNLSLFEIGPGRVLSGLARANGMGDGVKIFNINNLRGVEMAARLG